MNEILLNMYVVAVETKRIDINFVPMLYRGKVKEVLGIA